MEVPQIIQSEIAHDASQRSKTENRQTDVAYLKEIPSETKGYKQMQVSYDPSLDDNLRIHIAPKLTSSDIRSICEDQKSQSMQSLFSQHLQESHGQFCEIELLFKLNTSLLPKRNTQWLRLQIQAYLKENYNPKQSEMYHLKKRNKGVLLGHILYSILELKSSIDLLDNQKDQLIFNLKENEAVKLSTQIAIQLEKNINLLYQIRCQNATNQEIYRQKFQKLIQSIEKMGSGKIRKQFVQPSIYYPRIEEVNGEFYLKTVNWNLIVENLIFKEYSNETDEKEQIAIIPLIKQFLSKPNQKYADQKVKQVNNQQSQLQQICNQLTSCNQSSAKHSSEDEFILQRLTKFTSSVIYETQEQKQNEPETLTNNKDNQSLQVALENNLIQNVEVNQLRIVENFQEENAPDSPQLQVLCSTMDTSEPFQFVLEGGQNQRILDINIVIQNLQESNQHHEENAKLRQDQLQTKI